VTSRLDGFSLSKNTQITAVSDYSIKKRGLRPDPAPTL
jgi:hypothetical protein